MVTYVQLGKTSSCSGTALNFLLPVNDCKHLRQWLSARGRTLIPISHNLGKSFIPSKGDDTTNHLPDI